MAISSAFAQDEVISGLRLDGRDRTQAHQPAGSPTAAAVTTVRFRFARRPARSANGSGWAETGSSASQALMSVARARGVG